MKTVTKVWKDAAGAEATRSALIATALRLFGEKGYDATSTREIAAAARSNVGSIAYHFGGKPGLHRACGEAVAGIMHGVTGPALAVAADPASLSREAAKALFAALLRRVAQFMLASKEASLIVPFIMREMAHPGEAFDAIYGSLIEPVHTRLCAIWQAATGEAAEASETKLAVFAMIGQVVYFRIGAAAVSRRLGAAAYSPEDIEAIVSVVQRNIDARLNAYQGTPS